MNSFSSSGSGMFRKWVLPVWHARWGLLAIALAFSQTVSAGKLLVDEGVVVKFGTDAGMTVRQSLQTSRGVVLTSLNDDAAANQTSVAPGSPASGDWNGLKIEDSVVVGDLRIDRLQVRYAGANGAAALQVAQNYAIQFLEISSSLLGIRATGAARPTFSGLSLIGNAVGLESREDALPTLTNSEAVGNADFGVLNLSPQTPTQAIDVWWGAASGPVASDNEDGTGDKVSAGVVYRPFATRVPLIDCSLSVVGGATTIALPEVELALHCRNAVEYRLGIEHYYGDEPYQPMTSSATFPLNGSPGNRTITVEYRSADQYVASSQVTINYQPGSPVVAIVAPADGATITTDTTIAATASAAAGIDRVEFYVDATHLGTDATEPYEIFWTISGFAAGTHMIKVVAISTGGQSSEAMRPITLQPQGSDDSDGPAISEVTFDGEPLSDGSTTRLTASGMLRFQVSDPSGVDTVSVLLDGSTLSGGTLTGTEYTIYVDLDDVPDGFHELVLEATDGLHNISQRSYAIEVDTAVDPGAPIVTITAPAEGAIVDSDTPIAASVSGQNIRWVDFYVDDSPIGRVATSPYELLWQIGAVGNGPHAIKAVATDAAEQHGQATRMITVQHPTGDTTGPSIRNVRFDGQPLTENATIASSGVLAFSVEDLSGVSSVEVRIDGQPVAGGTLDGTEYSISLSLSVGAHTLVIHATDTLANPSEQTWHVHVEADSPGAPVVTVTAPIDGALISTDTTIAATVDGASITRVDFYADSGWIGGAATPPYEVVWNVAGVANGPHTLLAIATNTGGGIGQDSVHVTLQRVSDDTTGPEISDVRFAGQPLADDDTLTAPGLLTFRVSDPSGVASAAVQVDATTVAGGGLNQGQYSVLLDFAGIANGTHAITLTAVDTVGNPTERILHGIIVAVPPPPPPVLLSPVDATATALPNVPVSGTAQAGSGVQLFLNGSVLGSAIAVPFTGTFNRTITLPEEGTHVLTAVASNDRGSSAATAPVSVTYSAPSPNVVLVNPPEAATIEANSTVAVEASIVDAVGVRSATLKIDGHPVGAALSQPPYAWSWNVDGSVADGEHAIEVTAINVVDKSAVATRTVTVARTPEIPPVQTAYTGEVQSISPTSSYGDEPITIAGRAVDTATGALVPDALLKIVLRVNGFQRRISTSTNAAGTFSYRFVPQNSDAGVYVVSVIHPDQVDLPDQGQFTINRLGLSPSQYALRAARTVPATIRYTVSASAGAGASGVILQAIPADQPSGTGLPAGITIDAPAPVDVPAGGSVPIDVVFTAGSQSQAPAPTGTVVLTAKDGSGRSRGSVTINYSLSEPLPYLFPQPSAVQTGVKRGRQVSESVQLSNRGLIPAHNVVVSLTPAAGATAAPTWVRLAAPGELGDLAVGENRSIQIVVAPDADVGDDIYRLNIHVQADGISGDVPVAVAVTSAETGAVQFHAKDIYTCLPDCDATPGLANASIRIQNEQVYTETRTGRTDAQGLLQIDDLPIGHYRYVANAPSHVSATGRFTVRPGVVVEQGVFLDYELVTFEWTVTETTIVDQYDVTLIATYETQVPAPVMLIQPASINIPDMQEGEELTGEITITNHGLIRADNVTWFPAQSDQYFEIEYLGTPPDTFDAHQSYRLPYRLTKKCTPLPGMENGSTCTQAQHAGSSFRSVRAGSTTTAGTCHTYRKPMRLEFGYQCAAGDTRNSSAGSGFNKAYGQNCAGSGGGGGGGGGGGAGGWGGGGYGGPVGTPMASGPGCVPECPDCKGGSPGG